jgi:hypothetical protein
VTDGYAVADAARAPGAVDEPGSNATHSAYSRTRDQRERRPAVNDAQIWTLIGGFFALMTATTGLLLRTVRAEIGVVMARVDGRFDAVDTRLDNLDRDLHAVVTRLMDS